MPTYDYKCFDCDNEFEHFQSMSDIPIKICPKCNGKVRRLISGGTGLIFKGAGFYKTDYNKKEKKSNSKNKKDLKSSTTKKKTKEKKDD